MELERNLGKRKINPKVLVGCPTSEHKSYCLKEYTEGVKNLTYFDYDILLVDNSKGMEYFEKIKSLGLPAIKDKYFEKARKRIVHSRNLLRQKVLEEGYEYFLSLEQDVIPPKNVIEQLLKVNKKIVTGVYFSRYVMNNRKMLLPLLWKELREEKKLMNFFTAEEVEKPAVIKVRACGLGCILIHRSVLEKIKFGYKEERRCFDDMFFCKDAKEASFEIFADTSIKCKHMIKGMSWKGVIK